MVLPLLQLALQLWRGQLIVLKQVLVELEQLAPHVLAVEPLVLPKLEQLEVVLIVVTVKKTMV